MPLEQQAQVVMLVVGDVIGLADREQQGLDARPQQTREQAARAVAEVAQHQRQRRLGVGEAGRAAIEGAEQVDQHDLAIEAAEMIAIEGQDDLAPVALVAGAHQVPAGCPGAACGRQRADSSSSLPARSPGMVKRPGWSRLSPASCWQRCR